MQDVDSGLHGRGEEMSKEEDVVSWLTRYATATGAVGMSEEADMLMASANEITRLRGLVKELEGKSSEAHAYGMYWQMEALGGR